MKTPALNRPDSSPKPVSWQTPNVSLTADDFWIDADGRRFTAQDAVVEVHSDPGHPGYTTLELTWMEMNREMRLFIYFTADQNHWWSEEIRTYDGRKDPVEWLYFYGTFFKTPLGKSFEGNVDLRNNGESDRYEGHLHFKDLRLSPTFKQGPIPTPDTSHRSCTDSGGNTYVGSAERSPPPLPADCK